MAEPNLKLRFHVPPGWSERYLRLCRKLKRVPRRRRAALKAKLCRLVQEIRFEGFA